MTRAHATDCAFSFAIAAWIAAAIAGAIMAALLLRGVEVAIGFADRTYAAR
jgi:hypothetical protein